MIRIAGFEYMGQVRFHTGPSFTDIETFIPDRYSLTDNLFRELMNADMLETLAINPETKREEVVGRYNLITWRAAERIAGGIKMSWQTYKETDLLDLKERLDEAETENSDLTDAVIELAAIIGG